MAQKAKFAVVVPAYNEELVVESSLRSLIKALPKRHIFLVSDGSTDKTAEIAKKVLGKNTLNLKKNVGKARAIEKLLHKFEITKKYQYILFFDADTTINIDHFKQAEKLFKYNPACIVGTVSSHRRGVISAYRAFEYAFSHKFFKNAQNAMGTIVIAPGCTSIYRADVLDNLEFGGDTLTEDFDLTLQIHEKKLGRVMYCQKAVVITQDPETFQGYWKQISRWNTGYWQNFFLHKLYLPKSKVNLEILLLMGDFLFWLANITLAMFQPLLFATIYGSAVTILFLLSVTVLIFEKKYWAIPYTPLFSIFSLLNIVSFIHSVFRAIFLRGRIGWQKLPRYAN